MVHSKQRVALGYGVIGYGLMDDGCYRNGGGAKNDARVVPSTRECVKVRVLGLVSLEVLSASAFWGCLSDKLRYSISSEATSYFDFVH